MPPSDPLFGIQLHFGLIGNIQAIWEDYDGSGINVGIYDDGIDYNHEDLAANYDASLEVVDNFGNVVDPFPVPGSEGHGTAVAGLIAAADNGIGTVGVAHGATITGVNIFGSNVYGFVNSSDKTPFLNVVSQASKFDIMNNSWGNFPGFFQGHSLSEPGIDSDLDAEYSKLSENGRDGLGTVIVQAAGNDDRDANGDGTNASRFTITVAATEADSGDAASFSNFGQSILVAAPAANVTTDATGGLGYNSGSSFSDLPDPNYTQSFGGTSAATPVVSGVISLMLEANDELGWRDVQNILAMSASHTGSELGNASSGFEDGAWFFNGADNWNGGGNHFHVNYGYGMVDVFGAVRMAEVWDLFGNAKTSANEVKTTSDLAIFEGGLEAPGGPGTSFNLIVDESVDIEHVGLVLDIETTWIGDLVLNLTSPDGTTIEVYAGEGLGTDVNGKWYFGIDSLLGENAKGTWTVTVADRFTALDPVTINTAQLEVYGSPPTTNDVYHFTDEVMSLVTLDPSRLNLEDTAGSNDWLNFAALDAPGQLIVNLNSDDGAGGAFLTGFGTLGLGAISKFSAGTILENVVGGDGDDRFIGNAASNELHGMRGDDDIRGGDGRDHIYGNTGNDFLRGEEGSDFIFGNAGNDRGVGGSGNDIFNGGANNDRFEGGSGADRGNGGSGRDILILGSGNDNGVGGTGNDRLSGAAGRDILSGNAGVDTLNGGSGNDRLNGGSGRDKLTGDAGIDVLKGGSGNDRLNGGTGRDTMTGNSGRDIFEFSGRFGKDKITDFDSGRGAGDRIDFSKISAFNNFSQVLSSSKDVGNNVVITLNSANTITLNNTSVSDLAANDFIF